MESLDISRIGAARRMEGFRVIPEMLEQLRVAEIDRLLSTDASKDYIAGANAIYHDLVGAFQAAIDAQDTD